MESTQKEDKKQGADGGGEARQKTYVPCAGGWPMGSRQSVTDDGRDVLTDFRRIPPLPIVASFHMRSSSSGFITQTTLLANGGADPPALVDFLIRGYLNFTTEDAGAMSDFEALTLLHDQ